jgi:general transcription factor 3C polypeptide 3 (transcription factor C subunit 4)
LDATRAQEEEFGYVLSFNNKCLFATKVLALHRRLIAAADDQQAGAAINAPGGLGRAWDKTMEDDFDMAEMDAELGIGVRKRKKVCVIRLLLHSAALMPLHEQVRRTRADPEPSSEVKAMLGEANLAYVDHRLDDAIVTLTEVVRIEPTIRSTWFTLAAIHAELGNVEKSIQLRIIAAHLTPDAGEIWRDLAGQSRELGLLQQAIYCYGQAIKSDKTDVDAIWDRAALLQETGYTRQAVSGYTSLLRYHPHNPNILRELCPLHVELGDASAAINLALDAFEYWRKTTPGGSDSDEGAFGYGDLVLLVDMLFIQRRHADIVKYIKQGARWIQGRANESSWETLPDDREFDPKRKTRQGTEAVSKWFESAEIYHLPLELRARLGIARLHMNNQGEAKRHFDIVRESNIELHSDLFGLIADAYLARKAFEDALDVYSDLAGCEATSSPLIWAKMGQCQRALGHLPEAREMYETG